MQIRFRHLASITAIFLAGCSDNDLGVGAIDAAQDAFTPGSGGAPTGSGGAGSGGLSGSAADGAAPSTGGAGGTAPGSCGEATCLTSLFRTCVPAGGCAVEHAGGSPSAVFNDTCYANGITVSYMGSYLGTSLSVARNGALCYWINTSTPQNASAVSYGVTDGNGEVVATGITADKDGSVTVTCNGGQPTTVSASCFDPVSNSGTCDLLTCPSTGGYDGGIDADASDAGGGAGAVCDPLAPAPKPIALAVILGVGRSADGTLYVVDELDSTQRIFVSDASGALVRQRGAGGGSTSDANGIEYIIGVTDVPSPFVLEIDVPKSGAIRMGVLQGTLTDRKSFVIGQEGEELAVLPSSAIAGMPVRNLPGNVTVEYVATLPDGQIMLVTRPTDDWAYTDFRLFLGPIGAVAERAVANVTRYKDGGTTNIVFDFDCAQATAYFPFVRPDAGPNPPSATLTVVGVATPLTRQATAPAATYLCL